ncbi:MAG: carboxylesterase/lipase family protein [Gammaproteobacteria bacterium]
MHGIPFPLLALAAFLVACTPSDPMVEIDTGKLRGVRVNGVTAFKGIPFAASTAGENRWRPPRAAEPWNDVRAADAYAPFCPQFDSEMLWFELGDMSEDCLALNVWAPQSATDARLPVMVWIHGGGYVQGSGNIARLNSPALARDGVVLVTVNYRLTLFGFFAHPAMSAQQAGEPLANYGLMDIVAALEWVQRNIDRFGGDPDNVTIFGESAGAGLVNYLMVMPPATGLFHRAISQSSSVGLAPDAKLRDRSGFQVPGEKLGRNFVKRANFDDSDDPIAELRALSMEEMLALLTPRDRFTPVIDGDWIPDHVGVLFAAGRQHDVPYLTGGVSWEASLGRDIGGPFSPEFMVKLVPDAAKAELYPGMDGDTLADAVFGDLIIHSQSRYLGDRMATVSSPAWEYFFSYVADERRNSQPGVAHADEIAFVMQTLDSELDAPTDSDREVSELASAYWVQFAKTGNPNREGLPYWPEYTEKSPVVLEIGDAVSLHESHLADRMDYHKRRGIANLDKARD